MPKYIKIPAIHPGYCHGCVKYEKQLNDTVLRCTCNDYYTNPNKPIYYVFIEAILKLNTNLKIL